MQLPPLLLVPSGSLPPSQRWRLTDSLFSQRRPLLFGSLSMMALGGLCWLRTGSIWFLLWDLLVLAVTAPRLAVYRRYAARDLDTLPEDWARRYLACAIAYALLWVLILLSIPLMPHQAYVHFVVVAMMSGFNGGTAIRNNASPLTVAVGSIVPAVALAGCCLAVGNLYYSLLAVFPVVLVITDYQYGSQHGRSTLALLSSDQKQAQLYEQLLATCGELEVANGKLSDLSTTDELTEIANRRHFTAEVETAWRRAVRQTAELSVLLIDVDHFKPFNDLFGHPEGDRCLCMVAHTLRDGLRDGDLVARYGGEEFVVLLPQTGRVEAGEVAERLRHAVQDRAVPHPAGPLGVLTISVGVASLVPRLGEEPKHLVTLADRALYAAKRRGRNQIALAERETLPAA